MSHDAHDISRMKQLSPLRKSSTATTVYQLAREQLEHFGINPASEFGQSLGQIATRLYETQGDLDQLWQITMRTIGTLDRSDRIAWFNAKKFLSFQLAKLLDTLQ